ncbi:MAG: hypothetical protein ABJA02_07245, partial [Acidobacteriota bacterium]
VALQRPAAVEIFYDECEGLIGLVPAHIEAPDACAVRDRAKGGAKWISMKRFCTRFNLKTDRTIFFRNPAFDPDGTLVLNYRQATALQMPTTEISSTQPAELGFR